MPIRGERDGLHVEAPAIGAGEERKLPRELKALRAARAGVEKHHAGGGVPLQLERDLLREEMRRHRALLEAAMPDYFRLLQQELARPRGELRRCRCAQRFVVVRKEAQGAGKD